LLEVMMMAAAETIIERARKIARKIAREREEGDGNERKKRAGATAYLNALYTEIDRNRAS
jgi:hypothetical protein